MRIALLLVGIIELIGGLITFIIPHLIFNDTNSLSIKLYGLAAMVIGISCLFVIRKGTDQRFFKTFFLIMMFFQGALAMICSQDRTNSLVNNNEAVITHVVIFSILVIAYLKDLKPDQ